jgi:hypothetical protein
MVARPQRCSAAGDHAATAQHSTSATSTPARSRSQQRRCPSIVSQPPRLRLAGELVPCEAPLRPLRGALPRLLIEHGSLGPRAVITRLRSGESSVAVRGGTRATAPVPARGSRSIAERLLVHHPAERGRHPGALVEAERAGVARRVDAEPDAALAALPEAPEGVAEQRRADALLARRATREERVDKAAAVRVARADRPGGDLVPGADDAPERRVEALAPEVALRPRLEIAGRVVPVICFGSCVRRGGPRPPRARSRSASRSRARALPGGRTPRRARARLPRASRRSRRCGRRRGRRARPARGRGPTTRPPDRPARTCSGRKATTRAPRRPRSPPTRRRRRRAWGRRAPCWRHATSSGMPALLL